MFPSGRIHQAEPSAVQRLPVRCRQSGVHPETGQAAQVASGAPVLMKIREGETRFLLRSGHVSPQELCPPRGHAEGHLLHPGAEERRNQAAARPPDPPLPDGAQRQREGDPSLLKTSVSSWSNLCSFSNAAVCLVLHSALQWPAGGSSLQQVEEFKVKPGRFLWRTQKVLLSTVPTQTSVL